jgi:predicted transcriptional regulator
VTRPRFEHAIPNPSARRDIAHALHSGIPAEQLAEEFDISVSTVRSYAREWEGAQRRVVALQPHEVEAIRDGVRRGARARWERQYGAEVVAQVLGEV